MTVPVLELNHVAIHVKDLAASQHFYGDVLGLPLLPRPDFNFPGAWYAFGRQELHLIEETALAETDRHNHHFALLVEDTYAVRAELEKRGFTQFDSHGLRPDGAVQLFFATQTGTA